MTARYTVLMKVVRQFPPFQVDDWMIVLDTDDIDEAMLAYLKHPDRKLIDNVRTQWRDVLS